MRVAVLVLVLLLSNVPIQVEATSGRAMNAEIDVSKFVWTSAEEIPVDVYVSGAPFNQNITLEWELTDENGIVIEEMIIFQMGGSTHIVQFNLSEFYCGEHITIFRLRLVLVLQQLATTFQSQF